MFEMLALLFVGPNLIELPMLAEAISGDGKTIVGISKEFEGIVRHSDGSIRKLTCPPGTSHAKPTGVSDDGETIVGFVRDSGHYKICLWKGDERPLVIDSTDVIFKYPMISGDGTTACYKKIITAEKINTITSDQTKTWTHTGGISIVPHNLMGFSRNGMIQVGYEPHHNYTPPVSNILIENLHTGKSQRDDTDTVAMIWERGKEATRIGIPKTSWASYAHSCNFDGSVVAGSYSTQHGHRPFLWSKDKGLRKLAVEDGKLSLNDAILSSNGRYFFTNEETGSTSIALVWIDEVGPSRVIDEAVKRGLKISLKRPLQHVTGVSADGRSIIGYNSNQLSWLLTW